MIEGTIQLKIKLNLVRKKNSIFRILVKLANWLFSMPLYFYQYDNWFIYCKNAMKKSCMCGVPTKKFHDLNKLVDDIKSALSIYMS